MTHVGGPYLVELLFDRPFDLEAPAFDAAFHKWCPHTELVRPGAAKSAPRSARLAFQRDPRVSEIPVQLAFMAAASGQTAIDPETLEATLAQTRAWPGAAVAVARATKGTLGVTDLLASTLDAPLRLELFQRGLAAAVEALRPAAIHWIPANMFVDPDRFLAAMQEDDASERFLCAFNVRLFQVGNRPGEFVMDSMGLAALGLPDVQMHVCGGTASGGPPNRDALDPSQLAQKLFGVTRYLFENGDIIADGHTLEGIVPGTKWTCQHEDAVLAPPRAVVDIDPGAPFAAGTRHR